MKDKKAMAQAAYRVDDYADMIKKAADVIVTLRRQLIHVMIDTILIDENVDAEVESLIEQISGLHSIIDKMVAELGKALRDMKKIMADEN